MAEISDFATSGFVIRPDAFYPEPAPELDVLGKRQTRANHRHRGVGAPFIKNGNRVIYHGADILARLASLRIKPAGE